MDKELEQQVIDAYRKGWKVTKIEEKFGLPGATVYSVLHRNGITPQRVQRKVRHAIDGLTASKWLALINEQEGTIEALEEEVRSLNDLLVESRTEVATLQTRLAECVKTAAAQKRSRKPKTSE